MRIAGPDGRCLGFGPSRSGRSLQRLAHPDEDDEPGRGGTLRDLGFPRAADVIGGFEGWQAAGLPVVAAPD